MHTQGEHHVERKAETEVMHLQAKEPQYLSEEPLETRREAYDRFSLTALRRNQSCQHLGLLEL